MKSEDAFDAYERLIREWQERLNLVSRGDLEKIKGRHIGDSLKLYELLPELKFQTAIDVGCGAGFPGIPLSIVQSDKTFTLVESIAKKCAFLEAAVSALSLTNVSVICSRSEDLGREKAHRDRYDLAVARALAHPSTALELVVPLAKVGGACVFWGSGPDWADRDRIDKVAAMLGGAYVGDKPYHLEGDDRERKLVLVEKRSPTPEKYPRRPGVPEKSPLK
ncbi:MAG: 16S rRNA (guanine(527)-N(7))-methyltransferase RsmG [Elusimicrobia bacterium RIFCSPLOWO2_01_FULL_60_11]|nr:MAG: 16S rRNA (guanine(527)-N(7))-methyltransferase RsmG [Elusimicrobia bacterium RIFCSPLOWO2_01_FULL_60_11]